MEEIKKFAIEIYKILGAGYNETVYEEALAVEMRKAKINYNTELNVEIIYKGEKIGNHTLDFIVEKKPKFVVELKAAASISKGNRSQLKAYLKTLNLNKGLLINFPYPDKEKPEIEVVSIN